MLFEEALRSAKLSQGDLAVISYIRQHPQDVMEMTSQELGGAAFVSASTVVRLCKKAGFKGFDDLKVRLAQELARDANYTHVDSDFPKLAGAASENVIATISSMEREAVRKTEHLLRKVSWEPILNALDEAQGVSIFANGFSLTASETFALNLERLGKRVTLHGEFPVNQHWATICPRDEFVLFVSYSGQGDYVERPARILSARGIKSLSITSEADCPLRQLTTWNLPLALTERRLMYARVAPFQSTSSESFALDTLYAMFFSRNYLKNTQTIARSLKMQGVELRIDGNGDVVFKGIESSFPGQKAQATAHTVSPNHDACDPH